MLFGSDSLNIDLLSGNAIHTAFLSTSYPSHLAWFIVKRIAAHKKSKSTASPAVSHFTEQSDSIKTY